MKASVFLQFLIENGWQFERVNNGYQQFIHPEYRRILTIPPLFSDNDLKTGTFQRILEEAELIHRESGNKSFDVPSGKRKLYKAVVEIDKDYSSSGFFPHIPGCFFACSDPKEAIESAAIAVDTHFNLLAVKGMNIPLPHDDDPTPWLPVNLDSGKLQATAWFDFHIDVTKYSSS